MVEIAGFCLIDISSLQTALGCQRVRNQSTYDTIATRSALKGLMVGIRSIPGNPCDAGTHSGHTASSRR